RAMPSMRPNVVKRTLRTRFDTDTPSPDARALSSCSRVSEIRVWMTFSFFSFFLLMKRSGPCNAKLRARMTANQVATTLRDLDRGFRASYLSYDDLTAQVHGWAEAFPEFCRVSSIGTSTEGRSLWLLTIGPDPDRIRPAVWVDGNMHAGELC